MTGVILSDKEVNNILNEQDKEIKLLKKENEQLKLQLSNISAQRDEFLRGARENANRVGKLKKKNEQLKSENKRLIDKLNKTALELVDVCISQGKATEISEMSYIEFLDFRAKNNKPMELRK